MSSAGKIYAAIAKAAAEISPIAKAKRNAQQGFNYRGIDDVMNELSPVLAKHGIFVYPEVVSADRSERQTAKGSSLIYSILTVRYHFAADDGSEVCATVIGEGMDSGDKSSNKAMAVAMKYACLQMFCIPTEDMSDPDSETPPPSAPKDRSEGKPARGDVEEGKRIVARIGEILKTLSSKGEPFYPESVKDMARKIIQTNDIEKVRRHLAMLEEDLKRLMAADLPGDHFESDIPF